MTHLKVFPEPEAAELDAIEITSPCDVPWESLRGDERVRACGRCRKNVYNIEALTRIEALRLIRGREGRICVRLRRRPDGTVVTGDCWARLRAARRRGLLPFVGMLFVVGGIQVAAMVVGLRGFGTLVGGHRMGGAPVPMPAPPPKSPPPLPKPPAREGDVDVWLMGEKASVEDAPASQPKPRRPRQRHDSAASDDTFMAGGFGLAPRKTKKGR